jgi:outer membrane receptor protein involved in Fe transport
MRKNLVWLAIGLFIVNCNLFSQPPSGGGGFDPSNMPKESKISGKIIDQATSAPVEYATIGIYSMRDSSLISGGITDVTGVFLIDKLPYGRFYLDISFVGYKKMRMNGVGLSPNKKEVNVGEIKLEPSVTAISEVEVVGNRSQVEYKIDKKVINVSSNIVAAGGTAVDALENTPSIQVDIEGNVALRGSSNFTVLIDGRPSVLKGSDALQQIPASTIQNIEIITNPSAKYDPEGTSGIINLIMKKQKQVGINGVVNTSVSTNGGYSGDFLVNMRASKVNYFIGANYRKMRFENKMVSDKETYINTARDTIYYELSNAEGAFNREGYGLKGGIDFYLTKNNTLSLSGSYMTNNFSRDDRTQNHNYNSIPSLANSYFVRDNIFDRDHNFFESNVEYIHKFNDNGHQLEASVNYSYGPENEKSLQAQYPADASYIFTDNNMTQQRTTEGGNEKEFTTKLDYSLPISEKSKLEAGYQGDYEYLEDSYVLENNSGTGWIEDLGRRNKMDFSDIVHAIYTTYAGSLPVFDFQLGLRTEYTDRNLNQKILGKEFSLNKWDIFPTLHLSKKLKGDFQIQTSYSRRIRRPGDRHLDPCEVVIDSRNVRVGNPEITPEYTNSYEFNVQKSFKGAAFISAELFHRNTTDLISDYEYKRSDTISVQTYRNLNSDYSTGLEGMVNMPLAKWWTLNTSVSLFNYRIKSAVEEGEAVDNSSFSWNARFSSIFRLKCGTQIQLMGFYSAPNITSQGSRDGFFFTNIGVRQDFFKRKLTASIQMRDIFGNNKNNRESSGTYFKSSYSMIRQPRVVTFSLSFKINNYKPDRMKDKGNMSEMEYSGDSDMM